MLIIQQKDGTKKIIQQICGDIRERSKEFFPEAIARNEEEGNGPFVPLQSCKVKIMRDKILNTLKLLMYESQDEN